MISISQRKSTKAVGKTSLYVSFQYNPRVVELVKSAENAIYNKTTHEWELPLNKLSYLIDSLTYLDDIELDLLPDNEDEQIKSIVQHRIKPFDYQKEGIDWLINRDSGLLLDDMGLGKTLQVIYAAEELKAQKGVEHCLIVCGINTLKQNWKKEINKFSNESCRIIGEKINSKGNIAYSSLRDRADELYNPIDEFFVIINIESFRESLIADAILNSSNKFDMIVVDECHRIKDPQSSQSKGLLKIAKQGKYKFGLTGTLLINSPLDAYVALKFIGHEKANYTNFKQFYCNLSQQFGHFVINGYKNLDILKEEVGECSLRRTKDLLDLPPKVIIPEYIEMGDKQAQFYKDLQEGVVEEADRVNIKTTSLLGLVTRLRQAATCPSALSSNQTINSCKIDRALELIEDITNNGNKVVVFSTFKEPLYQLQNRIGANKVLLCTGDQTDEFISQSIDKFQNEDDYKIMLCTSSRMGTGVTLTAANYEIFIDSAWTQSLESQAEDRCYRVGTKSTVFVYKLIAIGTIDDRIQAILERKRAISDFVIDDKVTSEVDELRELLGIGIS